MKLKSVWIKIIDERKKFKSVYHLYQFYCERRDQLNNYLRKNMIDSKLLSKTSSFT